MKLLYVLLIGALLPVGLVLYIGSYCIEQLLGDIAQDDAVLHAETVSCELNAELFDRTVIWKLYGNTLFVQDELAKANQEPQQPLGEDAAGDSSPTGEFPANPAEEQSIQEALTTELSQDLSEQVRAVNLLHDHLVFGEVLITDRRGALVAANNKTSDYWQNDETWWQQAVDKGIYISDKHYDESAAMESIAICLRIDDQAGEMAGVLKAILDIQDIDSIIRGLPTARITQGDRKTWLLTKGGVVLGAANTGGPPYHNVCDRLRVVEDAEQRGLRAVLWTESEKSPVKLISFARPVKFGDMSNPNWMLLVECNPQAVPASLPQFHYALKFIGLVGVIGSGAATYFLSRRFKVA